MKIQVSFKDVLSDKNGVPLEFKNIDDSYDVFRKYLKDCVEYGDITTFNFIKVEEN